MSKLENPSTVLLLFLVFPLSFFLALGIMSNIFWKCWGLMDKATPYECGFSPVGTVHLPFSLQFFNTTIIFVIFDIELTLLFPGVLLCCSTSGLNSVIILMLIITLLTIGLLHELAQGVFSWVK